MFSMSSFEFLEEYLHHEVFRELTCQSRELMYAGPKVVPPTKRTATFPRPARIRTTPLISWYWLSWWGFEVTLEDKVETARRVLRNG